MKVAISLPDELSSSADELAERFPLDDFGSKLRAPRGTGPIGAAMHARVRFKSRVIPNFRMRDEPMAV